MSAAQGSDRSAGEVARRELVEHTSQRDVEGREAAVDEREQQLDAREAAVAERADATQTLLDDAEERDRLAHVRDTAANRRDLADPLDAADHDDDAKIATLRAARGAAALDRRHARADRAASKSDRLQLADAEQSELGGEG